MIPKNKDHSYKVWSKFANSCWREHFKIFPIGSYAKTMSADWGHFGDISGSLDTIRTIPYCPSNFVFCLNYVSRWWLCLMHVGVIRYNSEKRQSKNWSIKVWSQIAWQFHRRSLNIFLTGSSYVKTMSFRISSRSKWRINIKGSTFIMEKN